MFKNMVKPPRDDAELEALMNHLNKVNQHHLKVSLSESRSNKLRDYACALSGFTGGYQSIKEYWEVGREYPFHDVNEVRAITHQAKGVVAIFAFAFAEQIALKLNHASFPLFNLSRNKHDSSPWLATHLRGGRGEKILKQMLNENFPITMCNVKVGFASTREDAFILSSALSQDPYLVANVSDDVAVYGELMWGRPRSEIEMSPWGLLGRYLYQNKWVAATDNPTRYVEIFSPDVSEEDLLNNEEERELLEPFSPSRQKKGIRLPFDTLTLESNLIQIRYGDLLIKLQADRHSSSKAGIPRIVCDGYDSQYSGVVKIVNESEPLTLDFGEADEDGNRHLLETERRKASVSIWQCGHHLPWGALHIKNETIDLAPEEREGTWLHDEERGEIEIFCSVS